MKQTSDNLLCEAKVGDNVTIPIPQPDQSKGDSKNLIGVIMKIEDNACIIKKQNGILKGKFARSQFDVCKKTFLARDDVPSNIIGQRTAANKFAMGQGQGHFHCNCSKKCDSLRYACKKKNRLCNSRCHPSLTCNNK